MPSEYEQSAIAATPINALPPARPIVTWEFLEANAVRFAHAMGEPTPKLVMKEGMYKSTLAVMRGTVPMDPGVLAILDLEESKFYLAHQMVLQEAAAERRSSLAARYGFGSNSAPITSRFFLTLVVAMVALVAAWIGMIELFPASVEPRFRLITHALLYLLEIGVITIAQSYYIKSLYSTYFARAAHVAGNADVGRSCIQKVQALYYTKRGTKPLKGLRRLVVSWGIWLTTPRAKRQRFPSNPTETRHPS
jgi:hypothetical protein